ncbi:MAG TPA: aminoglycoside phosphotransferase family protein [Streptosporangiaceae bacterium]|nr:aminoglycoside phosphotransferase family protein [Streptosporangiaceae bacterium]
MTCDNTRQMLDAVRQACPGFATDGRYIRTETSLLLPGRVAGVPVLAKHPVDPRPFWQDRCRHEIAVYQALAREGTVPLPVPALVTADAGYPLLVMTRLPGRPLHPCRYPPARPSAGTLTSMLAALRLLHNWRPSPAFPDDSDYTAQFTRIACDLIPPADLRCITRLCDTAMPALQIEHGDAHLANALATPAGVALVDLECTAWRPAGYDLAKLWVFLAASPSSRAAIASAVSTQPRRLAGFWVAVTLVTAREITSCLRHPGLPAAAGRLRQLNADLRAALSSIRRLHDEVTWQKTIMHPPAIVPAPALTLPIAPGRVPRRGHGRPRRHHAGHDDRASLECTARIYHSGGLQ